MWQAGGGAIYVWQMETSGVGKKLFVTKKEQRRSLWLAKNEPGEGESRVLTKDHVTHRALQAMV